ncbi:MAG TPA: TraM recognition domain-containing protein [Thermoanaerobaculia bacterium]|nr:TraM recognition domain-containing protein [Thermoanaerobaculia bacterium]
MNIPIGRKRIYYGWDSPFEVDLDHHGFFIGKTGTGKSTVLEGLCVRAIRMGLPMCIIDPHGSLADGIAGKIPRWRQNDVIWFDPADPEKVLGLNLLEGQNPDLRLDQLLSILANFYGSTSWLGRADYVSRNLGMAVMRTVPNVTVIHITRAFVDDDYRHSLSARVTDEFNLQFFKKYDETWDKRQREEAAASPLNKFDILNKPVLRDIVGQPRGINFGEIMAGRKILICRFAKGQIGGEVAAVLGALVTAGILFAALEREVTKDTPTFGVVIDEFHNLTRGVAHEHLLSETRKYRISLTMADQTIEQLPEGAEAGIFGNVSNLIVGKVGATDARRLAAELGIPEPLTLQRLSPHYWYGRTTSDPILFEADGPIKKFGDEAWRSTLIRRSRSNYGQPRQQIEAKLQKFLRRL